LFRNFQCFVDVDTEIPDGALRLAVSEEELDDSQILVMFEFAALRYGGVGVRRSVPRR
jgi:hypothetical protein